MHDQARPGPDLDLDASTGQELSEEQLQEISGGTPDSSQKPKKTATPKPTEYLVITMHDVLVSS
jgi:bacteriocin-like protein